MAASTARSERLETPNSAFRSPSCRSHRSTDEPWTVLSRTSPAAVVSRGDGRVRRGALQSSTFRPCPRPSWSSPTRCSSSTSPGAGTRSHRSALADAGVPRAAPAARAGVPGPAAGPSGRRSPGCTSPSCWRSSANAGRRARGHRRGHLRLARAPTTRRWRRPARRSRRWRRCSAARTGRRSPWCARRATTPSPTGRWGSASSTTPRSRPRRRGRSGRARVLILDWDVHHGNGTQARVLGAAATCSTSRCTSTRSTRAPARRTRSASGPGAGFTVNVPLPGGTERRRLRRGLPRAVPPDGPGVPARPGHRLGGVRRARGRPAGRDARHRARLRGDVQRDEVLAEEVAGGRLVLLLEGGYSLVGLPRSVHACLEVMGGRRDEFPRGASRDALRAIEASREASSPSGSSDVAPPGRSAAVPLRSPAEREAEVEPTRVEEPHEEPSTYAPVLRPTRSRRRA